MLFPATACLIQDQLGLRGTWGFDLSAACSGFLYALTTGAQLVASGAHERVVVVGADLMSSIIDPLDRTTAVLFGDGAGAALLERAEPGYRPPGLLSSGRWQRARRPDDARRREPPAAEHRDGERPAALSQAERPRGLQVRRDAPWSKASRFCSSETASPPPTSRWWFPTRPTSAFWTPPQNGSGLPPRAGGVGVGPLRQHHRRDAAARTRRHAQRGEDQAGRSGGVYRGGRWFTSGATLVRWS